MAGAFPPFGWPPLAFVAWLPILWAISKKPSGVFWSAYLSMGVFNALTTWWIWNAHWSGVVATVLINGALMAGLWTLYARFTRVLGSRMAHWGLPFLWIAFERFHQDWAFSFPWLTLGNVFANAPEWVQWYAWTGRFGGTLWIFAVNLVLLLALKAHAQGSKRDLIAKGLWLMALLPGVWWLSSYLGSQWKPSAADPVEVVILQPNVDPYGEKFSKPMEEQMRDFVELARSAVTPQTDLLLGPETMMAYGFWEGDPSQDVALEDWRKLQVQFPQLAILVGATTYKHYPPSNQPPTTTARSMAPQPGWVDVFNAAVFLPPQGSVEIYHKSKLVVGVEEMPFGGLLNQWSIDLGGASGSLGKQANRVAFQSGNPGYAPLICYESIYGAYAADYARLGGGVFCIMTNDGWWGNTPGYQQHMAFARLMAIEHRRPIVRAANTGISAVISPRGEVQQLLGWDRKGTLTAAVIPEWEWTFFTRYGDALGRMAEVIAVLLVLTALVRSRLPKLQRRSRQSPS
jgi:apolipoprotein N-acyltransferase